MNMALRGILPFLLALAIFPLAFVLRRVSRSRGLGVMFALLAVPFAIHAIRTATGMSAIFALVAMGSSIRFFSGRQVWWTEPD